MVISRDMKDTADEVDDVEENAVEEDGIQEFRKELLLRLYPMI